MIKAIERTLLRFRVFHTEVTKRDFLPSVGSVITALSLVALVFLFVLLIMVLVS
jgi:uncharacterized membrane protein